MGFQSKIADLGRLHEIIRAFSLAGFGDIFKKMGLEAAAERTGKIMGWKYAEDIAHLERPQRIRKLFEILGPTFVKLGQILATRPDLFGPEWISEFEKLQSQAPQLDFEELRPQIEEDLGGPLEEIFESVETKPLAAASMAQVHRATLKDGTKVILKIQRPGIRTKIESDMRLLTYLASLAERRVPELATYHPQKVVQQFVKSLQNELNFMTEGQNAEQVSANFEGNDQIVIPKIYWEWTKERISVQEFVEGIPGVNIQAIDLPEYLPRNSSTATKRSPGSSPALSDHSKRIVLRASASFCNKAWSSFIICCRLISETRPIMPKSIKAIRSPGKMKKFPGCGSA